MNALVTKIAELGTLSDCVFFELFQHRPIPAAQGSQHAPHPLRCHDAESDILHARGPFPALGLEVARLLLVIVSKHDLPAARPARERRRAFAAPTSLSLGDEIFDDQVCFLASKTYLEVLLPKIVFVIDFPAQQTESQISGKLAALGEELGRLTSFAF